MCLHMRTVTERSSVLPAIRRLYCAAFPDNERKPLTPLLRDKTGHGEVVAFYDGARFCGFACLLNLGDISHIIYFAVEELLRGKGYGSAAISLLREQKRGMRIIADVEVEDLTKENNAQRRKRKQFYLRNGFAVTDVAYDWCQESYEILSCGGVITAEEFGTFWKGIYAASDALLPY